MPIFTHFWLKEPLKIEPSSHLAHFCHFIASLLRKCLIFGPKKWKKMMRRPCIFVIFKNNKFPKCHFRKKIILLFPTDSFAAVFAKNGHAMAIFRKNSALCNQRAPLSARSRSDCYVTKISSFSFLVHF